MNAIAIIGDYRPANRSHVATDGAVAHCSAALGLAVQHCWIGTDELAQPNGMRRLAEFNGFWIAPGSPYKSMSGALSAIQRAREQGLPLLGTCGGFQHVELSTPETCSVLMKLNTRRPALRHLNSLYPAWHAHWLAARCISRSNLALWWHAVSAGWKLMRVTTAISA